MLHSYSGDALTTARYSGFLQAALPRGFNVVFPEAVGHEWHDSPEGNPAHADDVAFVAALVEKLTAEQMVEVVTTHQSSIVRKNSHWTVLESAEHLVDLEEQRQNTTPRRRIA